MMPAPHTTHSLRPFPSLSIPFSLSLSLALSTTALASRPDAPNVDRLAIASRLVVDGRYDRAEAVLAEIDAPKKADAARYYTLKGMVSLNLDHHEAALATLQQAVEAGAAPLVFVWMAQARLETGDPTGAIADLDRAGEAGEAVVGSWQLRSRALREIGDDEGAYAALLAGRARFPDHRGLLEGQLAMLVDLGLTRRAVEIGTTTLPALDASEAAWVAIGDHLRRAGALDDARAWLEEVRLRFPTSVDARVALASACLEAELPLCCGEMLQEAAAFDNRYASEAAECFRRAEDLDRALYLNGMVADDEVKVRQRLGLLLQSGAFDQATSLDARLSRLGVLAQDESVAYALAYAHAQNGNHARAEELLSGLTDPRPVPPGRGAAGVDGGAVNGTASLGLVGLLCFPLLTAATTTHAASGSAHGGARVGQDGDDLVDDETDDDEIIDDGEITDDDEIIDDDEITDDDEIIDDEIVGDDEIDNDEIVGDDKIDDDKIDDDKIDDDGTAISDDNEVGDENKANEDNKVDERVAAGAIAGFAFDAGSGAPIANARVTVVDRTVQTDRNGAFVVRLPGGSYALQLRAPDRQSGVLSDVVVGTGEVTEVLITFSRDAIPTALVEAPPTAPSSVAAAPTAAGPPGVLAGVVRSDTGQPVEGARVYVRGRPDQATTDADGAFRLDLPAGPHALSVLRNGYTTHNLDEVVVPPNDQTAVEIALAPAKLALASFTIRAPYVEGSVASLLDERKESSAVADVLGAEEMSRSGAGDAASALARVTGLTVVGGRYVYVRGMGDRFSSSLLNGSMLPSPEPERRVVPLDLFPASILEGVLIQKTWSPDMPAEFGGGVVQLRTIRPPTELIARVSVSGSYRHGTTFPARARLRGRRHRLARVRRRIPRAARRPRRCERLLAPRGGGSVQRPRLHGL